MLARTRMKPVALVVSFAVLALLIALAWWLWTPDRERAALHAQYLNQPGDIVTVAGTRLHLRDSHPPAGRTQAPTLLLLHGFGGSLHTWEPWVLQLARDYRVIRIDLPGSGLSEPDPQGNYADAHTLALLVNLLDQLGIARASVIGHSIGGRIAWRFAAAHPARVDRLVLLAPDGFASPGFEYGVAPEVPTSFKLMRFALPRALLRMSLLPAYADPAVLTDEMTTRYHALMLAPGSRQALLARMAQTVLIDPRPLLRTIQAKTLLVWGEQDAMIPIANAAEYLAALPQAQLVRLDGVGHLPQEEQPTRGLAAVQEFLKN